MNINTFKNDDYEITLIKQNDCLTIKCLNLQLLKIYSKDYSNIFIEQIVPNIDNFHAICLTCIKSWQDNILSPESNINIICMEKTIQLAFNFTTRLVLNQTLNYDFTLELPLVESVKMSGQDQIIKKLQSEINYLNTFINKYMELTIHDYNVKYTFIATPNSNNSHPTFTPVQLSINTKHIKIINIDNLNPVGGNIAMCTLAINGRIHLIDGYGKFNANFALIKCHVLLLDNIKFDIGFEHLPPTIKRIQFIKYTKDTLIAQILLIEKFVDELPNFDTIEFIEIDCNGINFSDHIIKPLKKINRIIFTKCQNIQNHQSIISDFNIEQSIYPNFDENIING